MSPRSCIPCPKIENDAYDWYKRHETRCELAKKKIRVNTVSPGVVITPINYNLPHIADPERRAVLEQQHLLGLGETEDVANACIYLLSDASKWVTGIDLCVDGGYTAR